MRETVWHGEIHQMVTAEGVQKKMSTVLEERGVDHSRNGCQEDEGTASPVSGKL